MSNSAQKTVVYLNELDHHRDKLHEYDQNLDEQTLIAKAKDPTEYCTEHHPEDLQTCTHSLDNIYLSSGFLSDSQTRQYLINDIYAQSIDLCEQLVSMWSLSILAIAMVIRIIFELSRLSGQAGINFPALSYDFILYTSLTGAYILIIRLIASLYLDIASYFNSSVLLDKLHAHLRQLQGTLIEDSASSTNLLSWLASTSSSIIDVTLNIIVSSVATFVKILQYVTMLIHSLLFTLVVIAGTVIIPLAVSGHKTPLFGWMKFFFTVSAYPVVQALLFWAVVYYFDRNGMFEVDDGIAIFQSFEIYFVELLVNICIIIIYFIAPFATNIFVVGSGNLTSVLMPAYIMGTLAAKGATNIVGMPASKAGSLVLGDSRSDEQGKTTSDEQTETAQPDSMTSETYQESSQSSERDDALVNGEGGSDAPAQATSGGQTETAQPDSMTSETYQESSQSSERDDALVNGEGGSDAPAQATSGGQTETAQPDSMTRQAYRDSGDPSAESKSTPSQTTESSEFHRQVWQVSLANTQDYSSSSNPQSNPEPLAEEESGSPMQVTQDTSEQNSPPDYALDDEDNTGNNG